MTGCLPKRKVTGAGAGGNRAEYDVACRGYNGTEESP